MLGGFMAGGCGEGRGVELVFEGWDGEDRLG